MTIPIDISEESGIRYLHFGSEWIQGAMRIRKPDALELDYTREMMVGLLLRDAAWPKRVLLIGLGAGSLAKFIHRHLPEAHSTVVEIAPEVHAVARQFFKLPDEDERLQIVIGDGADFVTQDARQWDLIAVDGFDRHARAGALATQPFYEACRARLSDRGLLAVNLFALVTVLIRVDEGPRLAAELTLMAGRVEFPLLLAVLMLYLVSPRLASLPPRAATG